MIPIRLYFYSSILTFQKPLLVAEYFHIDCSRLFSHHCSLERNGSLLRTGSHRSFHRAVQNTRFVRERPTYLQGMCAAVFLLFVWYALPLSFKSQSFMIQPDGRTDAMKSVSVCGRACVCVWVTEWEAEGEVERKKKRWICHSVRCMLRDLRLSAAAPDQYWSRKISNMFEKSRATPDRPPSHSAGLRVDLWDLTLDDVHARLSVPFQSVAARLSGG